MSSNLDDEIEDLQTKISSLKKQLRIHTSTLITAPSTRQLLTKDTPASSSAPKTKHQQQQNSLLSDSADQQEAHTQECLYRACATLTTFRARDPDPCAVDAGAILGLRIEVISRARFLRPYYVLLNRPYLSADGSRRLRVHRHTLPACIPLAGLAARYLPPPAPATKEGSGGKKKQDLARFARAVRRDVVRYHNRLGVVADLRKAAGVGRDTGAEFGEEEQPNRLVNITAADSEVKQLTIEWADGRTGRLVMGNDGEIVKLVVLGENGRDREAARGLLGGAATAEDVVKRLAAASV
ncbi:Cenp-O kinetochore centromere component-domain-containing protein [Chaetomium tenue]|uniref:Cenp-O kinetochore centromere component-domain-containing protein n=1 Tax=Chaetomium tenue TaxID=1854479 RepID=A0ACB7P9G6_9PEZI|nr:Cenp-O kinetochore centromere component-domain-containing protein [Chaetomium globosum]